MRIGTRSLLYGYHQVFIHAVFTFIAWLKVMRRLPNLAEFVCIIVHDWGYFGKPNMDGEEGETHPEGPARIVGRIFGQKYHDLCLYHSRFYAKQDGAKPSILCWVDKYSARLYPTWLWVFLAWSTGEIKEYMTDKKYEIHGQRDPWRFKRDYNKIVDETWMPKYVKGWRHVRQ